MTKEEESEVVFMTREEQRYNKVNTNKGKEWHDIKFIIDSGAAKHLISSRYKHLLVNVEDLSEPIYIHVAKQEETLTAKQKGIMKVDR